MRALMEMVLPLPLGSLSARGLLRASMMIELTYGGPPKMSPRFHLHVKKSEIVANQTLE